MKEKIFKNFSLKILSVVCAIILWTIIVNVNDPNTGYTFSNVTVQLINTESLTDNDYTYEVVDGGKISVYVSGPKSIVTDLKASDIVATADLSKITAFTEYVDIDVQIIKDGAVRTDVEATPKTSAVKLSIDNRISQNFNINIENVGTLADGYSVVNQSVAPNTVRITGSSALIAEIDTVKAVVDLSGMNSDISMSVPIIICDIDDNVLSQDGLEMTKTDVDYSATIQLTKSVPLRFSLSGSVAEGYNISGTQASVDYVSIAGSTDSINAIHEIMIPADQLNIASLTRDKTFSVDLTKVVPEGVSVVSSKTVQITVRVESTNTKNVVMDLSQVKLINLSTATAYTASMSGNLTIAIQGERSVIDAVKASDIQMTADLSGLGAGTHSVGITFTLPTGCTISQAYQAEVTIGTADQPTTEQTTAEH